MEWRRLAERDSESRQKPAPRWQIGGSSPPSFRNCDPLNSRCSTVLRLRGQGKSCPEHRLPERRGRCSLQLEEILSHSAERFLRLCAMVRVLAGISSPWQL